MEYQKQELQDLQKQLQSALAERERELSVSADIPLETKILALEAKHQRLKDDLVYVAQSLDQNYFNHSAPVVSRKERYTRRLLKKPEPKSPSSLHVPFDEFLLNLIHLLATNDKAEHQYLHLIEPSPDTSESNIATEDESASRSHNPRHVEYLHDLAMLETFQDNPRLVRLLPEYKEPN